MGAARPEQRQRLHHQARGEAMLSGSLGSAGWRPPKKDPIVKRALKKLVLISQFEPWANPRSTARSASKEDGQAAWQEAFWRELRRDRAGKGFCRGQIVA